MSPGIIDNNEIIYNFTDVFTACSLLRSGQAYCSLCTLLKRKYLLRNFTSKKKLLKRS